MYYEKKVRYLDYYENGERIKGSGFLKLEVREESLRLELTITGLYPTDSFARDILLCSGNREEVLGQVVVLEGKGEYRQQCHNINNIADTGIAYDRWTGIRIPLGAGREILCSWQAIGEIPWVQPKQERGEIRTAEQPRNVSVGVLEETKVVENTKSEQESTKRPKEDDTGKNGKDLFRIDSALAGGEKTEERSKDEAVKRKGPTDERVRRKEAGSKPVRLLEDKWQQLCAIYPHVRPFRDEREYLSIGPADFVLFTEVSYKLVNNSFLLHGYYNYNHLILTRIERKGEICYYIGVPGNFFEKEKQVAIMFGFESFECAEEPAQTGDFGYYMMRTLL